MSPAPPVRVLGIDPGSRYTGYGVIDVSGARHLHIAHGRIDSTKGTLPERLLEIFDRLTDLVREYTPHEAAIEETFVNRVNAASALVLGQARGTAICALARGGLSVAEYAAAQVKLAVTGSGRADKVQVQKMVGVLLKLHEPPAGDAADGLAVALTHAQVRGTYSRASVLVARSWR